MNEVMAYCLSRPGDGFANDKWDFGLLQEIFDKYKVSVLQVNKLPDADRAFVCIPGSEWTEYEDELVEELNKISKVVLFVTANEDDKFNQHKIIHSDIKIWLQYPFEDDPKFYSLPTGTPSSFKKLLPEYPTKNIDLYFAGQINHDRRMALGNVINKMSNAIYLPSNGFAQGLEQDEYYKGLSESRIAPAPAGVVSIDSFRVYEALELLCFPIVDKISSKGEDYNFWQILFGKSPLLKISHWSSLPNITRRILKDYPGNMHRIVAWWIKYKRDLGIKIMEQINE